MQIDSKISAALSIKLVIFLFAITKDKIENY